ncbi:hypothetical protein BB561_000427 [Smittium simulii]|uniref:Kinetochore protein NDC80 n=1 Tax=Smittium simulii TaxID=133385 RepID=A0A2T9YFB8_9FUNG|nr:hypothetical protein BB561_004599 [Smittium simulii]PVU97697.1 hypothetical protein BB561_000427 [Smittium simulii]
MNPRRKTVVEQNNNQNGRGFLNSQSNSNEAFGNIQGNEHQKAFPARNSRFSIAPQSYSTLSAFDNSLLNSQKRLVNNVKKIEPNRLTPKDRKLSMMNMGAMEQGYFVPGTQLKKNNIRPYGQTPAGKNIRANFADTGRRTTFAGGLLSTVSRVGKANNDPRPLRDPQFQYEAKTKIINYLSASRYPNDISIKALESPTKKIIEDIFKFIYGRIDPYFVYSKKIEDDIEIILRVIEYPYLDGLSKSKLRVLSSSNSWNVVLGFLVWMTELNEIVERMENSSNYENPVSIGSSIRFEDKVFYHYLIETYPIWLNGNDEPGEIENDLANQFAQQTHNVKEQNELLEAQINELKAELKAFESEKSPLSIENDKKVLYENDKDKLLSYYSKIERKQPKLENAIEKLTTDIEKSQNELEIIMDEIKNVTKIINEQQISVFEVDKMNTERERLCRILDEFEKKLNQKQEEIWEKESKTQQLIYEIDDYEHRYNENSKQLYKYFSEYETNNNMLLSKFLIKIDSNANDFKQLCVPNLKDEIEQQLYKVRENLITKSHDMQTEIFKTNQENNQLEDMLNETSDKLTDLNKQAKRHQEICSELRSSILEESLAPSMEIDNLEKEVFLIEKTGVKIEQQAKHDYMYSKTKHGYISRSCNDHSASLCKELIDSLDEVLKMQNFVRIRLTQSSQLFS